MLGWNLKCIHRSALKVGPPTTLLHCRSHPYRHYRLALSIPYNEGRSSPVQAFVTAHFLGLSTGCSPEVFKFYLASDFNKIVEGFVYPAVDYIKPTRGSLWFMCA